MLGMSGPTSLPIEFGPVTERRQKPPCDIVRGTPECNVDHG